MADLKSKFDNIEMLEIPSDDEFTSSETESMTDSRDASSADPEIKNNKPRTYVELNDWISTDTSLEFQFDVNEYKNSLNSDEELSRFHNSYVNSLFKVSEDLSKANVTSIVSEEEEDTTPIGVISDAPDIGGNALRQYRDKRLSEAFSEVIEHFQRFLQSIRHSISGEKYQEYHLLLNILDCIYATHFAPSLRERPGLLSKWVNRYDCQPDNELVEEVMIHTPTPYLHPKFWNTYLAQLITRGCLNEASEALSKSKFEELQYSEPNLFAIIQDLQTLLADYRSLSYKGRFRDWKLSVSEFREAFTKLKEPIKGIEFQLIANQIYQLLCALSGYPVTLSSLTSNWYELFLALSLFDLPDDTSVIIENYRAAIHEKPPAITDYGDENDEEFLVEQAFVNTLETNFMKVLETIAMFDQPTAAYVSRLFELKGLFTPYYQGLYKAHDANDLLHRKTVSEYLLTKHAYENLNNHPLVPAGIGLLVNNDIASSAQSSANNRKVIAEFLPHFEFKSNDDLEWGLTICAKLDLVSTAKKLYLKYGKRSLKDGHPFEALNMFVQCYDPDVVSEESSEAMLEVHNLVWDTLFLDALLNNRPVKDELINNIVQHRVHKSLDIHPVIRQCLSPYAVLAEYFSTLEQASSDDAPPIKLLSKLIHLIRFNHLPKKFTPLLMAQFLPFFHKDSAKFQLPDLIIITELIDTFENNTSKSEYEAGDELYQYSLKHRERTPSRYDWRVDLDSNGIEIPSDVNALLKYLRVELVAKIGRVFIGK